jgi:hypothetical protein
MKMNDHKNIFLTKPDEERVDEQSLDYQSKKKTFKDAIILYMCIHFRGVAQIVMSCEI